MPFSFLAFKFSHAFAAIHPLFLSLPAHSLTHTHSVRVQGPSFSQLNAKPTRLQLVLSEKVPTSRKVLSVPGDAFEVHNNQHMQAVVMQKLGEEEHTKKHLEQLTRQQNAATQKIFDATKQYQVSRHPLPILCLPILCLSLSLCLVYVSLCVDVSLRAHHTLLL